MATDNTADAINSIAKVVFAQDIINLVPDDRYLVKNVKFKDSERLGRNFEQPVILSDEQGFTYADEDDGLYDLDDSVAMTVKTARISGQQITGRAFISLKEAAVALKKGEKAFANSMQLRIKNMTDSASKRLEVAMLYGRAATGLARCVTGTTLSATQYRFTVPAAQWASGIWSGAINAKLECFNDTGTQVGTGAVQLVNMDFANRYLTVEGVAGVITSIDGAIGTGIVLHYKTAKGKEMHGLDSIILNTGTLFEINAATYPLWKGNEYSAGSGDLTMEKLLKALYQPIGKGLQEDVVVLLSPATFANLNSDEAALRMFDSSYDPAKSERGNKKICYFYQHGKLEIVAHNMVKEGEAFCLPLALVKRVGATDLTFNYPGQGDKMFSPLESKNGVQFRIYADQAIFLDRPGVAVKIKDIVNS
jgi:hypothetical protein